jgi:ketosteroid isomerase-like protein
MTAFDFAAFRAAFEARDLERWQSFHAPNAEWLEYRATDPPWAPNVMHGREEIGDLMRRVAAAPLQIAIANEVIDSRRAASRSRSCGATAGGSSRT